MNKFTEKFKLKRAQKNLKNVPTANIVQTGESVKKIGDALFSQMQGKE